VKWQYAIAVFWCVFAVGFVGWLKIFFRSDLVRKPPAAMTGRSSVRVSRSMRHKDVDQNGKGTSVEEMEASRAAKANMSRTPTTLINSERATREVKR
jgi:hypothetical protein